MALISRLATRGNVLYASLAGLLLLGAASGFFRPSATTATPTPEAPRPMDSPAAPEKPAGAHPMDEPLRLLAEAKKAFAGVKDYTCLLVKQERVRGAMQPVNVMTMMVRNQPFSVYLKWHQPKGCVGQEACYVAGRNGGRMRVKSSGLLGVVGFVSLDPNDERAKKASNHTITEAGLGNLLNRYEKSWTADRQNAKTQAHLAEYEYNKRRCIRVETIRPAGSPGVRFHRSVVYFDKELKLPVRVECYDWPRRGGNPKGDLVEVYSYANLKLNVNLPDSVFDK